MTSSPRPTRNSDVIHSLTRLLKNNGDRILNGSSKLSLTTLSLSMLNEGFARICDIDHHTSFEVLHSHNLPLPIYQDLEFLHDFIQKTIALKVIHGSRTLQGRIRINEFRSLRSLELKKVPIHLLEGLTKLRGRLETVICSRSIHSLQDLMETCGGDMSTSLTWTNLKTAIFSYNSIEYLDSSLRLLPMLETIDLSHNSLQHTDNYLENLTELLHVNLAFNFLESVPSFSVSSKARLRKLILRNNNIDDISGLKEMWNLHDLDLSYNCLTSHHQLKSLHSLQNLKMLQLNGNPIAYHPEHRDRVVVYISQKCVLKILLDGQPFTESQLMVKQRHTHINQSESVVESADQEYVNVTFTESFASTNSHMYEFKESENIAKRSNPSRKRKTKNILRQVVKDGNDSLDSASDLDSSRNITPFTIEDLEVRRRQFGHDWLMTIPVTNQESDFSLLTNQNEAQVADEGVQTENEADLVSKQQRKVTNLQDDIYLDGPDFDHSQKRNEQNSQTDDTKNSDSVNKGQINQVKVVNQVKVEADIHHNYEQKPTDENLVWRSESEEKEIVPENESEPFIVTSKGQNVIVSVCDRFINEKNLEGSIVERLDLKSLTSATVAPPGGDSGPELKLSFDYVKKNRRERVFVMEDTQHCQEFMKLLEPVIEVRRQREAKGSYQCLKCSKEFPNSKVQKKVLCSDEPSHEHADMPPSFNEKGFYSEVSICPYCGSDMLVEIGDEDVTCSKTPEAATPIGSFTLATGIFPMATSSAKSTPKKKIESIMRDNESFISCEGSVNGSFKSCDETLYGTPQLNDTACTQPMLNVLPLKRATQSLRKIQFNETVATSGSDTDSQKLSLMNGDHSSSDNSSYMTRHAHSITSLERRRFSSTGSDISVITDPSIITLQSGSANDGWESQRMSGNEEKHDFVDDVVDGGQSETMMGSLTQSVCKDMLSSVYETSIGRDQTDSLKDDDGKTLSEVVRKMLLEKESENEMNEQETTDSFCIAEHSPNSPNSPNSHIAEHSPNTMSGESENETPNACDLKSTSTPESEDTHTIDHEETLVLAEENTNRMSLAVDPNRIGFSYEDFSQVDHRLKLFLSMTVLNEDEEIHLLLKCSIIYQPKPGEISAVLIFTDKRMCICTISGQESPNISSWLKSSDVQWLSDLKYVHIGLGHQKLTLDFDPMPSRLTLLLRDEVRCKAFLAQFTAFLHQHVTEGKLQGISKTNTFLLEHIKTLLCVQCQMNEQDYTDSGLVKYYLGFLHKDSLQPITIIVTDHVICFCSEDHSTSESREPFEIVEVQKIVSILQVILHTKQGNHVTFDITEEESMETHHLHVVMETDQSVMSLVSAIKVPWEREFEVDMDIVTI